MSTPTDSHPLQLGSNSNNKSTPHTAVIYTHPSICSRLRQTLTCCVEMRSTQSHDPTPVTGIQQYRSRNHRNTLPGCARKLNDSTNASRRVLQSLTRSTEQAPPSGSI